MNLKVLPNLEKVIAAAQEANIAIADIQFVRDVHQDVLESLSIEIEGNDDAKSYFSWLLNQSNLMTELVS